MRFWHKLILTDVVDIPDKEGMFKKHTRILTISKQPHFPRLWKLFGWATSTLLRVGSYTDDLFPDDWHGLEGEVIKQDEAKNLWHNFYFKKKAREDVKAIKNALAENIINN